MIDENGLPTQQKKFGVYATILVDTSSLTDIVQISTGSSHILALDKNGRLFGWGTNSNKQIKSTSTTFYYTPEEITGITNARSIYGGSTLSYVIKNDGTVWAWGYGYPGNGSLLTNQGATEITSLRNVVSLSISNTASLAITANGGVLSWGSSNATATAIPGLANVTEVFTNHGVSYYRLETGDVYASGTNAGGALGLGTVGGSILSPIKTLCP